MPITVANIQDAGNYFRRSTETADFTAVKSLEAAALAVEDVHTYANYRFTQRVQRFDFLDSVTDYVVSDNATNFEAPVRAPDFRAVKDLRMSGNQGVDHDDDFDFVDPNYFALTAGRGKTDKIYTIEERDGGKILRVNRSDIGSSTTLHQAADHDANGTWAVDATNSDAINIGTDTIVYVKNSGSIKFDADVSQSSNNRVTVSVSDMTAVDISAYQNTGIIRFWLYIPEVTDDTSLYVTSVEFRWGSSSSAYWSQTVARPVNNAIFQDRWNLLQFDWRDAVETGSVTETAINYLLVTVNYAAGQGDDIGFRINDIKIYNPKEMKLVYFSNFTVKTTSTLIWKARATATTDELLCPDMYKNVYVDSFNWYAAQFLYPQDNNIIKAYELKYRGQYDSRKRKWVGGSLERLVAEQGEKYKLPTRKLRPQLSW